MSDRESRKILRYLLFGMLAAWAVVVMVRFYQEHVLGFGSFWRLLLRFPLPPPPSDILKILSAMKHLGLLCLLALAGIVAGRRLLRLAGLTDPSSGKSRWDLGRELALALGLGWGLLMYLTLALGIAGGLYSTAIWALILLAFLVGARELPGLYLDAKALLRPAEPPHSVVARVSLAGLVLMLLLIVVMALAPSITHDAMVYHLNVPRVYSSHHGIVAIPYDLFSNTLLNLEMLYTAALLIDDFILANLIHFTLGVGVLVFMYCFARDRFGPTTALLATLIFFFNPCVMGEMPIAYGDIAMTFYFTLALYCLWRWRGDDDGRWFLPLCVFAGIFAGMKYTSIYGLVSISAAVAAVELVGKRGAGEAVRRLAVFGLVVALFVSPYLVKNYLITGNPVYPAMYNIFGGRWLVPAQVERLMAYVDSHGMGHDWRNLLSLPWNITIFGNTGFEHFDTVITPLWLIFLPALAFIRPKSALVKWSAVICAVYFLAWAASTHITRYMMPVFPLLSLLCAHSIVELARKAALSRRMANVFKAGVMLVCGLVWFSFSYFYPRVPAEFGPAVWGGQTRDEFLARKVINYPVFRFINEELPADARLVLFWDNRGYFCERSKIGDSALEAPSMIELVHRAGSAEDFHRLLSETGVTHVYFNKGFLERFPPHTVSPEDQARFERDFKIFKSFLARYCLPLFSSTGATLYEMKRE